ncbi:low-density lipoprotein receptor-related protein [Sorangium cellulosum]|uniref:Low-density lipoprotein receptor-related protein n=1 Tax=Sorangium cellulosum TaxID=56 RepID=A0A4P2Q1I4_SORCE|nr:lipoprotein receptor [Sorangium cellulosum]AUX23060.1 low-density lipoprotein receptor-related protein [Sorangium cellulosum]
MRQVFRVGWMLGLATAVAACTSLLGDFDVGTGDASSAGGGGASATGGGGASSTGGAEPCPAGWRDCDGNPAGCEVDVTSDPQNCGACGAVCLAGGSCSADGCSGVTEIARGYSDAAFLAIYQDEVYWTAGDDAAGSVLKVSIHGGPITRLAAGQNAPYGIAVNAHGVFWSNLNAKRVMKVDHEGKEEPRWVVDSDYVTLGVVADEADVFWAQRAGSIGTPGNGSLIGRIRMPDGEADARFRRDDMTSPHLLALDEGHVYWVDRRERGGVNRTSRRDGGPTTRVANDQSFPYAVAVDRDHVYWVNNSSTNASAVMRAPKDGRQAPKPVWVPSGEDDVRNQLPNSIAVDDEDSYVYWTDQGAARVWRKRKDGSGNQETLYRGGVPRGIVLHGDFVYWVNATPDGAVLKLRRPE